VDTISRIKINPFSKHVGGFMSIGASNTAHFLEQESRAQAAAMREELPDFFGSGRPGKEPRATATLLPALKQTFATSDMNLGLGSRT
jgi:rhamnosyltransferase subunit A